ADKADKKAEKAADKADKAADKADKAADKAKSADDRLARKLKEHDAQREKLKAMLKGPIDEAMRQELRRNAERLARLERIKTIAQTEKDTATVDKVTALITKENARHDAWMAKHAGPTTPPVMGSPPVGAAPATDDKAGAK